MKDGAPPGCQLYDSPRSTAVVRVWAVGPAGVNHSLLFQILRPELQIFMMEFTLRMKREETVSICVSSWNVVRMPSWTTEIESIGIYIFLPVMESAQCLNLTQSTKRRYAYTMLTGEWIIIFIANLNITLIMRNSLQF